MQLNTIFREEALARRSRQEPLEDRLQVTAPHEWILVTGLGAALLALLAWGLFGSVERSLSFDAILVSSTSLGPGVGPLETLAFVAPREAARIEPGMPARVRIAVEDGGAGPALPAVIESVSARPVSPPAWLPASALAIPDRAHMVRVSLPEGAPESAEDGATVSLRIVVGRSSLLSLVLPGRD